MILNLLKRVSTATGTHIGLRRGPSDDPLAGNGLGRPHAKGSRHRIRTPVIAMLLILSAWAGGIQALPEVGTSNEGDTVFEGEGAWVLDETDPLYGQAVNITVRDQAAVILDGFLLNGTVFVEQGGTLQVVAQSKIYRLHVSGNGTVSTNAPLEVRHLTAIEDALIDAPELVVRHPPPPEDPEEVPEWEMDLLFDRPNVTLRDQGEVILAGMETILSNLTMSDDARLLSIGSFEWPFVQMSGNASFEAPDARATSDLKDNVSFLVSGLMDWGLINAYDNSYVELASSGGARTGFSLILHDEADAVVSDLQGGRYDHQGSGVFTFKDTVVPFESGSQREVRIWMQDPESRMVFENFQTLPGGAWFPGCFNVCPPLYGVLVAEGGYLKATDSSLLLELLDEGATVGGVPNPRLSWLELDNTTAHAFNSPISYTDGYTQNSGECVVMRGVSATNHRYDDHCARLEVLVEDPAGDPLEGADVELFDAMGRPVESYDSEANEVSSTRVSDPAGRAIFQFAPRGEPVTVRATAQIGSGESEVTLVQDGMSTVTIRPTAINLERGLSYGTIQSALDDAVSGETILVMPGGHEEALTIAVDGITLCSTQNGDACDGDPSDVRIDGGDEPAVIQVDGAEGVTVQDMTLRGADQGIFAENAHGLGLYRNQIESRIDPSSANHGVQLFDSSSVKAESNRFIGNLYPGSIALNLEQGSDDVWIKDNRIERTGTGIRIAESNDATLKDNHLHMPPVSQFGSESLAVSLHKGGGHTSSGNVILGAGIATSIGGSTDVTSENDQILGGGTAIRLRSVHGVQPTGLSVRNSDLSTSETPLHLMTGTTLLDVDAVCNDWGVYTASGIENARIDDEGSGNQVDYVPFIAPQGSSPVPPFSCLRLPNVNFTVSPDNVFLHEDVAFTDQSQAGSNPPVERRWDFGDGSTIREFAPFTDDTVIHHYDKAGPFTATLTVTDSQGAKGVFVKTLEVLAHPPQIHGLEMWDVPFGETLSLNFTIVDPNGEAPVTLTSQNLPPGAHLVKDASLYHWRLVWSPAPHQVGVHEIMLVATNIHGLQATHELTLEVTGPEPPDRRIDLSGATASGFVSSGQTVSANAALKNLGIEPVDVAFSVTNSADWGVDVNEEPVTLQAGETIQVPVEIQVGAAVTSRVTLNAHVLGDAETDEQVTWRFEAPLQVDVQMKETTSGSPIEGVVKVTNWDGSPVAEKQVQGVRANGFDTTGLLQSPFSGQTNDTGELLFSFPSGDTAAQLPGTHWVDVVVDKGRESYRGHIAYQVKAPLI